MTSKLDEIKNALAEYDAAVVYFKDSKHQDVYDPEFKKHDKAWDSLQANGYDYLRTLLAVAAAAAEYVRAAQEELSHERRIAAGKLEDALKALD